MRWSSQFASLFILISLLVSIIFFQKIVHVSSIKLLPKTTEKIETLDKKEPIHIGKGFEEKQTDEIPRKIIVPRLNIDIPIVEAPVIDGEWTVSDQFANHGIGSANPGQKGNMVIFAHAKAHLFLPLSEIQKNDDVYVLTSKKWYSYKIANIVQVVPTQVEVVSPTRDQQLTLFTCLGNADEKRFIAIGKPVNILNKLRFINNSIMPQL